ncbi:hypothetical protein, partial [Klebsiella pneumoniae]
TKHSCHAQRMHMVLSASATTGSGVQDTGIKFRRFNPSTEMLQSHKLGQELVIKYQLLMTILGF